MTPRASARTTGAVLVLVSSACFGTTAIFGKLAYTSGVQPMALLAWRFGVAAVILTAVQLVRGRSRGQSLLPPRPLLWQLWLIGGVLLTSEVVLYFVGLQTVSAGLTETLLFLYPAWVVVIAAVVLRHPTTPVMITCVITAVLGAALTVGGAGGGAPLGVTLVVGASFGYATYVVLASRFVPRAGSLRGTLVVITATAVSFVVLAVATGSAGPHDRDGWVAVLGLAFFGTVLSLGLLSAGLSRIDPSLAAIISTVEPVVTVALGAIVLGESVRPLQLAGMAVILASVAVLLVSESRGEPGAPEGARLVDPGTIPHD